MEQERILIVGLNWIGDAIMSMPAIQSCRAEHPDAHITMLVKPYLKPLWQMHAVPDDIQCLGKTGPTIATLRSLKFDKACILPNSFRSAFLPAMAGIPQRIGLKGELRRMLLTNVVPLSGGHQSNEYFPILAPESVGLKHALPALDVPGASFQGLENHAVLMPGAARGTSKMGPLQHFDSLARKILEETDLEIVFAGGAADAPACEELADGLGDRAISVAGKTSLKEWAALLKNCRVAVANDSGGMHLAGAVGAPVVGIYGITDPDKTGPLARAFKVVQNSTVKTRDIARNSKEASKALESISPGQVFEAVVGLIGK